MRLWRSRAAAALVLCALVSSALAQMASRNQKVEVSRVGSRIACQCGCSDTVATCSMLGCSFSHPAKLKIAQMQGAGSSDQSIIDAFVKEYGPGIYRSAPNAFGWVVPYVALALGLIAILWFVRHSRRTKPALVFDAKLARYNEQIDKEIANLDQ
ncbi:MAG: cytochrome c-type biogenesis protein CcmH [Bryobacteraceae bacterium]